MRTVSSGAIIMTTVMDSLFMEVDASSRVLPVLMTSEVVGLFFTQNKVFQTQREETQMEHVEYILLFREKYNSLSAMLYYA